MWAPGLGAGGVSPEGSLCSWKGEPLQPSKGVQAQGAASAEAPRHGGAGHILGAEGTLGSQRVVPGRGGGPGEGMARGPTSWEVTLAMGGESPNGRTMQGCWWAGGRGMEPGGRAQHLPVTGLRGFGLELPGRWGGPQS